jgi:hypothetical protein
MRGNKMTVQRKLIEIITLLEQELQELRSENSSLIKRAEDAEYRLKQVKVVDTVTVPPSEGWPSYTYDATMAPLSPLDVYTYTNQPKYEPVTIGNSCASCGVKVEGVIGHVCKRPECPVGLNYGYSSSN